MAPPKKQAAQKFSLADFTNMVEKEAPTNSCWADEEVDLPSAPTGMIGSGRGGAMGSGAGGEYRPGRGPERAGGSADLSRIPTTGPFSLYLGNLPYTVHESDIRELFASAGVTLSEIKIPMDQVERRPRGFAYVQVSSADAMRRAIEELSGREFLGRSLRLDISESTGSGGGSGGAGFAADWRSAAGQAPAAFADRPGRRTEAPRPGFEDRPGRRPDPPRGEWRTGNNVVAASNVPPAAARFDRPSDRPSDRRPPQEEPRGAWRRESEDTPSPRPTFSADSSASAPRPPRPSQRAFTRDDFGKKLGSDAPPAQH